MLESEFIHYPRCKTKIQHQGVVGQQFFNCSNCCRSFFWSPTGKTLKAALAEHKTKTENPDQRPNFL
jgi:hypothetical protein